MKFLKICILILLTHVMNSQANDEEYLRKWKEFYPSGALGMGFHECVFHFENRSNETIDQWLDYNQSVLAAITNEKDNVILSTKINNRLLKTQLLNEIHQWQNQRPHQSSLEFYNKLFNQALYRSDRVDYLTPDDVEYLRLEAYKSISTNCQNLISNLKSIEDTNPEKSISQLNSIASKINQSKIDLENSTHISEEDQFVISIINNTLNRLKEVSLHIDSIPKVLRSPILGKEEYTRRLALYTDSDLNPRQLESMTLHEIKVTKDLMKKVAVEYLTSTHPEQPLPENDDAVIKLALEEMEKDVVSSAEEYLTFWEELAMKATKFIDEQKIATLPDFPTLQIKTAPESAGAAARIGWVASAPPFAPNPVTTLFLPSIPDTLSEQEQIDFWSSFNKPFNRMIVIHELIPGHYMQLKISRETPHKIRLFFPYGPYIEGWATFCEMIALDHGWDKERPLTYLAHLRKRLENANRAYTSVMVHCNGWDEEKVMNFSVETSLLAPQFAKSLWGRLMRSPMQITSYYYGRALFVKLYEEQKNRMGDRFVLRDFMDTIMKAGPIPVDEFNNIFESQQE